MPSPPRHDTAVLDTLERHRRLLLQEARALQSQHETLAADAEEACGRAERLLEAALASQRAALAPGTPVAVQALWRAHQYASAQAATLARLHRAREERLSQLARAREQLAARLEDVKAIERLRERLQRAESKWARRRDQLRLDELGIIKGWKAEVTWR